MRIAERVSGPDQEDRRLFAELLADGPGWLRENPLVAPACRALEIDVDPATRRIFEPDREPSAAAELARTPEPFPGPLPNGVAVIAAGISLRPPSSEPERRELVAAENLLLHDLSFHVRRGEHLGVLGGNPATAPLLLRVAAGLDRPFVGQVDRYGTPVLVSALGKLLEPGLSLWDNIALLAGYAGLDVRDARARAEGIAEHAGVTRELSMPLLEVGTTAVLRMVVTVLLECTSRETVLFLDELPRLEDHRFVRWAAERAVERRREGLTIVQACGERDWPLGRPTRILWLPEDEDPVCGYPESILDRLRRQSLQLEPPPPRVPTGVGAR
jgi:ABC-type polysaccharide/polyol phosphate transport system ATPase subunit